MKLFNKLHENNKISKAEFLKVCPVGSRPRILCRNPKVHKPVVYNMTKFRPVLFAINIPEYTLAKFLIPILELLTQDEFTVEDSFSFAKKHDSSLLCQVLMLSHYLLDYFF